MGKKIPPDDCTTDWLRWGAPFRAHHLNVRQHSFLMTPYRFPQRYPGARKAFARLGRSLLKTVHRVVSIARAIHHLHYRPQENFAEFLERLNHTGTVAHMSRLGSTPSGLST